MSNINVTVQFDGIAPEPDWRHVFEIEKDGVKDALLSTSETPDAPAGWRVTQYMGRVNVAGQSPPAPVRDTP